MKKSQPSTRVRVTRKSHKPVTSEKLDTFRVENKTGDFILSKKETKVDSKLPNRIQVPILNLVLERSIAADLAEELKAKRKYFLAERVRLQQQWNDLERKEYTLKLSFQYFNKFVRENMEKRERAAKKVGDDKILRDKRIEELEVLQTKTANLQQSGKNLDRVLRQHLIYERYLGEVVTNNQDVFRTVDDALNKYETLHEARERLLEKQEESMGKLEHFVHKFLQMSAENNLYILGLNNILAHLEERYKRVNEFTLEKEMLVQKIKVAFINRTAEIETVKESAYNMYLDICAKKNLTPKIPPHDYESLLISIKNSIDQVNRIENMIQKSRKGTGIKTR